MIDDVRLRFSLPSNITCCRKRDIKFVDNVNHLRMPRMSENNFEYLANVIPPDVIVAATFRFEVN